MSLLIGSHCSTNTNFFWQLRSVATAEAVAAVQVFGIDAVRNFLCPNNSAFGVSAKKVRQPKKHLTSNCLPPIQEKIMSKNYH